MDINQVLAQEFHLRREQIDQTVALIDEGATIPFIARYRKERTGSLDDQILREIFDRLNYLRNLEKRKEEIRASITEQDKMTEALSRAIDAAKTLVEAEDLYRPYRPKRKTRASVARARGLEPLAQLLLAQKPGVDPLREAEAFVNGEQEVSDVEAALQGAMDILAEDISDDARLRKELRELIAKSGTISAVASDSEADSVYRTYYDYAEPVNKIAHHRVLALDRGEKEGFLKVSVSLPEHMGESFVVRKYLKGSSPAGAYVRQAAEDSYKRLLFPSVEREIRSALTANAAEQAIKVFASNLRQLLMQPPVKNTVTLGLDPGFRTGCKVAVVDSTGKVLHTDVVHITANSAAQVAADQKKLRGIIETWKVTTIAIGNGTASRESEHIVAQILKELDRKVSYMVVSEAGASVYSASKLAAEEFPDYDVSLRSAVSIARRLQDPLSELVKIDPKAIGVGQYQHDMPKARMDEALAGVVEDCVNSVGVDINTASHSLFSHVAGINAAVAKNILAYREENGAFTDRRQLLKVPKLGKKAYEQCAGFIRVREGKNPLDNTAVHPESYEAAKGLLEVCGFSLASIGSQDLQSLSERLNKQGMDAVSKQLGVGVPTLQDIVRELQKPGRDVRDELPPPLMRSGDVMELKDLKPGMELVGTVRNVIDFGAFVDIGVHEDGLVHISQICDRYIKHPLDAVKVGQVVRVRVLDVDVKRKRIGLTMRLDQTNQ